MKQYIFLLLSLLAFASCSEQDISGGGITPTAPGSGFRLSVRLGNGPATRAIGDPFLSGSEEKRIDRLAFFVHTDEDGLQVYPPVPDNVTDPDVAATDYPNNVYLAETAVGSRQYTADVTLTAGGGYQADIVAVANLPKDYDYNQILTWDGLQDSVTVWATEMPACTPGTGLDDPDRRAFAMYGYTRHELVKEETNTFQLALERLVARIDITNEAYVQGMTADDPKGGFLLTSVRVLQARPASYLTPQPDYVSPDVATISDWLVTNIPYGKPTAFDETANPTREPDAVDAASAETDATLQYLWRTLYPYENSDTEHAPTALEIKGQFRGTEVTRRIDFIDADKQPIPLVRNHRYLVRILPAPGQTDITFDINVSEWDAVDTVNVKPDQTAVPEITNLVTNATEYINPDGQTAYDLYYTQDGEMTFEATCSFSPGIRVKYYNDRTGKWTTEGDWLTVEQLSEEKVTVTRSDYAYKCSYKVTFNKFDGGLTRKALLLVHNGGSEVECDTIPIRHVVTYPGTEFEPVGVGYRDDGSEVVWAPVNVGATKLATNMNVNNFDSFTDEQKEDFLSQMGYIYQWGRGNMPFIYNSINITKLTEGTYINIDEANNLSGDYANLCINNGANRFLNKIDSWPSLYDPCPKGWHIPDKEEAQGFAAKINDEKIPFDTKNSQYVFKGNKSGEKIYLLACGFFMSRADLITNISFVYFWTSNWGTPLMNIIPTSVDEKQLLLCTVNNSADGPNSDGYFLRCVMDPPVP
ncbi:hypothetical protein [Parabacteroides sp.]